MSSEHSSVGRVNPQGVSSPNGGTRQLADDAENSNVGLYPQGVGRACKADKSATTTHRDKAANPTYEAALRLSKDGIGSFQFQSAYKLTST